MGKASENFGVPVDFKRIVNSIRLTFTNKKGARIYLAPFMRLHVVLFDNLFCNFAALFNDVDTFLGVSHTHTLKVVVLNRSVLVNNDISYT